MPEPEYVQTADALDDETKLFLYDRATLWLRDTSVPEFCRQVTAEMREEHDREYQVSDMALKQAALEAAAEAVQTMADDGAADHV